MRNLTFVHPFDDPEVIAGQGTVGMEILQQQQGPLDAIFVAIGGGGLAAGIAAYVKRVRPEVRVIGVQPVDSAAMHDSLKAGRRVRLEQVGLFADGVAVRQVGVETFRLCREYLDEVILVDTDDICAATKGVFEDTRAVLEPAGALAVAGVKAYVERQRVRGQTFVAVACGAEPELRPAALHRRAGRGGGASRGGVRGDDSGKTRQPEKILRAGRPAQRHRV